MATQTLIHLSDIHVQRRKKERTAFGRIARTVAERYPGAPVLVTGDLTDSAKPTQMKAARKILDGLARTNPVLAVPGNHDYAWRGNVLRDDGWANWIDILGEPLGWRRRGVKWMTKEASPAGVEGLGVWPRRKMVYFGVDSGDPLDEVISARGWISKKLAARLAEQLDAHEGKTRVVLLHHHPFATGLWTRLKGSKRLMEALGGRCELLLFGHEHHAAVWRDKAGIPFIAAAHKVTMPMCGPNLMFPVIHITGVGMPEPTFQHHLELV